MDSCLVSSPVSSNSTVEFDTRVIRLYKATALCGFSQMYDKAYMVYLTFAEYVTKLFTSLMC